MRSSRGLLDDTYPVGDGLGVLVVGVAPGTHGSIRELLEDRVLRIALFAEAGFGHVVHRNFCDIRLVVGCGGIRLIRRATEVQHIDDG